MKEDKTNIPERKVERASDRRDKGEKRERDARLGPRQGKGSEVQAGREGAGARANDQPPRDQKGLRVSKTRAKDTRGRL